MLITLFVMRLEDMCGHVGGVKGYFMALCVRWLVRGTCVNMHSYMRGHVRASGFLCERNGWLGVCVRVWCLLVFPFVRAYARLCVCARPRACMSFFFVLGKTSITLNHSESLDQFS